MKCQLFTFYNIRVFGDVSPSCMPMLNFLRNVRIFSSDGAAGGEGGRKET